MYKDFFGFKTKPFSLLPNTAFLYLGEMHRLALDLLEYGLAEQTGFVVITGEIGSGKTLLIRHLTKSSTEELVIGVVSNTHPGFGDMMRWVCSAFGLYHRNKDQVELYEDFVAFLTEHHAQGRRVALIVDEAQNLSPEALEELRMLSNVDSGEDYLFQIILVGQPGLLDSLRKPSLVQLAQRVGVHFHLQPLSFDETKSYIEHRLATAGGDPGIFDEAACAAVYFFTKGTPRLINIICDLSLVVSYAHNRRRVGLDAVISVALQRDRSGLATFGADSLSVEEARRAILRLCTECRTTDEAMDASFGHDRH